MRRQRGVTAVEYAIILGLIMIVVYAATETVGVTLNTMLTNILNAFNSTTT